MLLFCTLAQFDGEEQKAGAIASVFFYFNSKISEKHRVKSCETQHFVFMMDFNPI